MAPTFEFEKGTQRYRYTSGDRKGQFVAFETVHNDLTASYQSQQKDVGRSVNAKLFNGEIDTASWMREQAAQLKQAHINMFALGFGGHARLGASEYGSIGNRLRGEYGFLRQFAQDIEDGKLSEAQINARADQYYQSLWQTYEIGREKAHVQDGFEWERRYTSVGEVCPDCVAFAAKGWQPIGSLPAPGDQSRCRANCRCWKEFSKGSSQPQNSILDYTFGWLGTFSPPKPAPKPMTTNLTLEQVTAIAQRFNPNVSQQDIQSVIDQIEIQPEQQSFEVVQVESDDQEQEQQRYSTEVEGFYWGEPTTEDLDIIQTQTGFKWQSSDWFMFPIRASDNLLWSSWDCAWHPSILRSMVEQYPGQALMVDHNAYEIEDTQGFFARSALVQSGTIPMDYVEAQGNGDNNRKILARSKGWLQVYLQVAVPASETGLIQALKTRQIQDVSTGSIVAESVYYCPNCSAKHGIDVPFNYKQADGEYFCPHEMPHPWLKMFAEMFGETDINWADYAVMGTDKGDRHFEVSLVGVGNLPSAEVLRPAMV